MIFHARKKSSYKVKQMSDISVKNCDKFAIKPKELIGESI